MHNKGHCRALNNAIRKYGVENFKIEILLHWCDRKYLNKYERLFIKHYDTLYPNGYNLTEGGDSKVSYTNDTKDRISVSHRKRNNTYDLSKNLPTGMCVVRKNNKIIGYRVNRIKGRDESRFCDMSMTMAEKEKLALEYIKTGKKPIRELPSGLHKTKNGYVIHYKKDGKLVFCQAFQNTCIPDQVRLNSALSVYKTIKEKYG